MTIRFHETLSLLLKVLQKHDVPIDRNLLVIRDGAGRLMAALSKQKPLPELDRAIGEALGGYVGVVPVITGLAAARLESDPDIIEEVVDIGDSQKVVRYLDRRIVGMDWLREPKQIEENPKRLVFASLKGGVGRSTALAVVAADLARAGKRVLAVDLDLEAPGIGSMLLPSSDDISMDRRPKFGVIDYLVENNLGGITDADLYDFVGVSPFSEGSIDVIPAVGRETDFRPETMIAKLSRALVEDNTGDTIVSVSDQVRIMIDRFCERASYDAVLIDARAGLSEISAAPLLNLGAELLLFGTDQPQTFRGYSYLLAHLASVSRFDKTTLETDWRYHLSFVQSKAPSSASKRSPFREHLYELCAHLIYDEEVLANGEVQPVEFGPGPDETGLGVPHDALYIQYHPDYDAFDPIADNTKLDPDVYKGPFGAFLERAWKLLNIKEEGEP